MGGADLSFDGQQLFNLLPALYRLRDAQLAQAQNVSQGPLQDLMMLVAEQLAAVEEDLEQLYDDQFIETCAPWAITYIGDLIGYQSVTGVASAVSNPRAEVAHTISFRRRKGTVLVLEQLARDVTGWGAHAVEFFKLLADTQYMNHVRLDNHYAPDLRWSKPLEYMNTGFDATAHKVDVRRIAVERGRQNIQNIGIFLWSLNAYSLTMPPAAPAASAQCYRFNPLGADMPLFNNAVSQGATIGAAALPVNVSNRLSRRVLCRDIQSGAAAAYYGEGKSVALYVGGALLDPFEIQVCDLSGDDGHWANVPGPKSPYLAAIDPELGRIALRPATGGLPPTVASSFYYGFNGDMGGGEYPRSATFSAGPEQTVVQVPEDFATIQLALDSLSGDGVVEITDSNTHAAPAGLSVAVNANGHIELRGADGCRPTLALGKEMTVSGGADASFDLNGLCVTYSPSPPASLLPVALVHAPANAANKLAHLGLTHCTLVPGWGLTPQGEPQLGAQPTLVAAVGGLQVVIQKSILGPIWSAPLVTATLSDSILDATARTEMAYAALDGASSGGALTLTGCTVVGKVRCTLLSLVSDSIIWAALSEADLWTSPPSQRPFPLWADRKQEGCVRFSFIPETTAIPRQFECVMQGPGLPAPLFISLRYGDPGYGKLFASTADVVRRGADDGGEMGAFHFVLAPLRETDLRTRMQEYVPVGLEYGIFYET
jgi:hypothetical protein